jgi:cell division protein DivIC
MKHSKKEKKRLIIISFAIVGVLGLLVSSVYSDWQQIMKNNAKITALSNNYDDLLDKEKGLKSEVTKLKDPNYVARYAKEKYLYSSSGETIIRMDDK